LGLQSDLTKILGTIPGPIIFGALIDQTCILWDTKYSLNKCPDLVVASAVAISFPRGVETNIKRTGTLFGNFEKSH